jgi:hypothetical protein
VCLPPSGRQEDPKVKASWGYKRSPYLKKKKKVKEKLRHFQK